MSFIGFSWRLMLTLLCLLLLWRVSAFGVARLYSVGLPEDVTDTARQALIWYDGQPEELYQLGYALVGDDPAAARALLTDAYALNPTRARPLLVLAGLAEAAGETEQAGQLVEAAAALRPVNAWVQEDVAAYWASRGRFDRAMPHWSRAIEVGSPRTEQLFAILRELLTLEEGQSVFVELARRPPPWWETFFVETARGKTELQWVERLYTLRRLSGSNALTQAERNAYVERLLREQDFEAAYLAWVNSLLPSQRQYLGLLYNGGFEVPYSGFGYDWHVVKHDRVSIARVPVEGSAGQSLRIQFRFSRTRFDHLYQPLYLAGGAYRVSGRYRSDNLYSESGLRWQLNCHFPNREVLGEGVRLLGSEQWIDFSFEAAVPEGCRQQELRLASADAQRVDEATDGTVWFDDLQIVRIPALSSLEKARSEARRVAD